MNVEGVKLGAKIISSSINIPSAKFEPTLGIKIDSTLGIKIEPQKEKKNKNKIKYIYHLVNVLFLELILCFYWIGILAWSK
ncbi:hypothetical protein [Clostridium sp. UBA5712]|uniref:hypothetical protein n=1 Tax=Clostridium sp. UBA5712 TaxID=1946368 RepID=UPI0032162355